MDLVVICEQDDEIYIRDYFKNTDVNIISSFEFLNSPNQFTEDNIVFVVDVEEGILEKHEEIIFKSLDNDMSLFLIINNVDTLFNLDYSPDFVQAMILSTFREANKVLLKYEGITEDKILSFEKGNVSWGSVENNWLINVPKMIETSINFYDMKDYCKNDAQDELSNIIPVYKTLLNMVIE